tara:strand:- start:2977 stop:3732 length:756 start_codon:yes stop_codon:yes gene_type:complete
MSDLDFKLGNKEKPKCHAIVYFTDNEFIFASYVIDFPITGDISKYIPEMFADQIPDQDMDKIIFPPLPEKFEGTLDELINLCSLRSDDLIYGGLINSQEKTIAMSKLSQIANNYSDLCKEYFDQVTLDNLLNDSKNNTSKILNSESLEINSMQESELLSEVTKIIGKIKFSKDNNEIDTIEIHKQEIVKISEILPENRKIKEIISYLDLESQNSEKLISAYISRAYSMFNEDYIKVKELETLILDLEKSLN